jgi:acetoin utilization protein AcuC
LPPGTGDAPWLLAFHAIVPLLLRQFRPQILVSQHGADKHRLDSLAHDLAGGRWLLTGGGGYDLVQVVPRTWTHLLAEAGPADRPADPDSVAWRDYVVGRTGRAAPEQMTDGTPAQFEPFESGYDPSDPVDRAIMATRNAVFPLRG